MSVLELTKNFFRKVKDEIFVDKFTCLLCDNELREQSAIGLCDICASKLLYNDKRFCLRCGTPIENDATHCLTCQNNKRNFDAARSALVFTGAATQLEYGLKFGGKKYFAKYMANAMIELVRRENIECDAVVAVPLSNKRRKERG